jgi:transglutaminase-like putative cysteine protease
MTALTERPPAPRQTPGPSQGSPSRESPSRGTPSREERALLAAVTALIVTACLPLRQVFLGLDWIWPVLAAALLAVGIAWLSRRFRLGPVVAFSVSVAGWALFTSAVFLGNTVWFGLLPTTETPGALRELWTTGIELVRVRRAPALAEPGLLLVTTAGVWAVAYTVEGMVFRLSSPVQAVVLALVLWVTPLVISSGNKDPGTGYAWPLTVPFLAACAWLLLSSSGYDLSRWGASAGRGRPPGTAWIVATTAIVLGVVGGRALPGARGDAWFDPQGTSTVNTSNPIVNIKARLVAQDTTPVLRTRSPRPVYLRLTSLDVYDGQREEWTSAGIRSAPVDGDLPPAEPIQTAEDVTVDVAVAALGSSAVLVPAVYQPVMVSGPASPTFQYDRRLATLTTDRSVTLQPGDRYTVSAVIPRPSAEALNEVDVPRRGPDSALPPTIPTQVRERAMQIVDEAGARTAFAQALAIQDELRTWTYSLEPAHGHSASAMLSFLQTREGYCEQFAGTMAVMLRTLGIPARVAVGYTPGTRNATGEYVVTDQNAHAWVEVRFPGHGWIAFEPTPRSDGNVLVPTAETIAPRNTDTAQVDAADDPFNPGEQLRQGEASQPDAPVPTPRPLGPAPAPRPATMLPLRVIALIVAGMVLLGAGLARSWTHRATTPADRVLHARARIERVGRGLGVRPRPTETDREYVRRLAGAHPAGARLAAITAAARYARRVTEAEATAAEAAATEVRAHLLSGLSVPRRAMVMLRAQPFNLADWHRSEIR